MSLSRGARINLKKRVADTLGQELWRNITLTLREFGIPATDAGGQKEDYVLTMMDGVDDELLLELDRHLHPRLYEEEESDEPDEPPMSTLLEGQQNTPFTDDERIQVEAAIDIALKQAREEYSLPADELRLLEAKLEYIAEAAKRTSGRIDWLNLTIGALLGRFADGVLNPDVIHKVTHALGIGLAPLFGHPPLLGP